MTTLAELKNQIEQIRREELSLIQASESRDDLEEVRRRIFGKKGRLSTLMRGMGSIPAEERPQAGQAANVVKQELQTAVEARGEELRRKEIQNAIAQEDIDVTLPGLRPPMGTLHPITRMLRRIEDIFIGMGFEVETGPEIEDDYHNFEALNFPKDHPARDMHDTFYLASDLLLRTHTSPVQIHAMRERKPPFAVLAPGRCYRCDTPDATHSPVFHQVEGFVVDKNIRLSDLKGTLEAFLKQLFGDEAQCRFRPHYFPFTEPSAEVDVLFKRRKADGQMVTEQMEVLGAGMIHPNVLSNCGIASESYSGFAFGMGIERLAMIQHEIHNMSYFFDNDVRFLNQFA